MAIVWVEFKSSASVSCRDEECRWPPSPPTSVSGVALASSASKTARNPREIEHGAIVATVGKKTREVWVRSFITPLSRRLQSRFVFLNEKYGIGLFHLWFLTDYSLISSAHYTPGLIFPGCLFGVGVWAHFPNNGGLSKLIFRTTVGYRS